MEYEGYLTNQEILRLIEEAFPFIEKPSDDDLYIFGQDDVMRKIIQSKVSDFTDPELPYEGVITLYDEFSTISQKAVEWLLPSMLRIVLKKKDRSGNLHWYLPTYFENIDLSSPNSAYNFSWLSKLQIRSLSCMLEYLSEEYNDVTGLAQVSLSELAKKI